MGRYVSGDIEYKFWFGIQPSEDIQDFGGFRPEDSWAWGQSDLEQCNEEIRSVNKQCLEETGISARNWLSKVNIKGYTWSTRDPETESKLWKKAMRYAAKFQLGMKIRRAIKKYNYVECVYEQ